MCFSFVELSAKNVFFLGDFFSVSKTQTYLKNVINLHKNKVGLM